MAVSTVANRDSFKLTTPSDREIRLTRLFDAPRHLVFEAMSKPEHVSRWWGRLGDNYSVPVCEIDLRPGGKWRFVNRTPTGELATFYGVYREIAPPDRLVYTEIFEPFPDAESVVTTVLTEENGKTRLTVTASYPSLEVRNMVLETGMERGAGISYDRLEDVAAELKAQA
ncbi:MAG TPA: SRPBCC family protein [Vicinamibacterales bacterium]|nr:SRPBCC family protein [Vicinamibacterales bacterium]